jgi:glutamate-ammonia-ligase adenylyltransferase
MRKKMETRTHTRSANFLDVKLGAGGMVDVECIAQMIQLKHGKRNSALMGLATSDALQEAGTSILTREQSAFLRNSYLALRKIELMNRLTLEDHGTVLPEGERLEQLARIIAGLSGEEFQARIAAMMGNVRAEFLRIASTLGS